MLNRTAGLRYLIRPHRGITHQHQAPIRAIGAQDLLRGFLGFLAAAIFAPKPFIRAVVEVVEFQMLEFSARSRKQFLADADMIIHGTANIHQQQHLHRIAAFRHHMQIKRPAIARRGANRARHIQFRRGTRARKAAQPAQSDLHIARG